ncbi:MAG: hypothetical protein U0324_11550 [Polyangiales bacterium]
MNPPLDTLDDCLAALRARCREGELHARLAALGLVGHAVIPALADELLAVVHDDDVDGRLCSAALAALVRVGVDVPVPRYRALLGEAAGALHCRRAPDAPTPVSASAVLCAARAPALVEQALAWVEGLAPRAAFQLLHTVVLNNDEPASPLLDALIARWTAEAPVPPEERDVWLAGRLAGRDERALALLARHWRAEVLAGRDGVVEAIDDVPDLWPLLRELPGVRERAQAALLGPTGALADALGPGLFARRLRNAVLRWSAHARTPGLARDAALWARYSRALRHLREWAYGPALAASLVRGATLALEVEAALLARWHEHYSASARAWLASLGDRARRVQLTCALLVRATAADLPALDFAFDVGDEGVRNNVLGAIDRLRGGDHHVAALRAFAAAGGAVGATARWCLVHRRDAATVDALVAAAREATGAARCETFAGLAWAPEVMRAHRAAVAAAIEASDGEGYTAEALVAGLARALGDEAGAVMLRLALTARHWGVREEAARQIAQRGLLCAARRG